MVVGGIFLVLAEDRKNVWRVTEARTGTPLFPVIGAEELEGYSLPA